MSNDPWLRHHTCLYITECIIWLLYELAEQTKLVYRLQRSPSYKLAVKPTFWFSLKLLLVGSKRCRWAWQHYRPPLDHTWCQTWNFGVWDHGWPKGALKCRHAHPHLLDPINKRIRANQNVGTTASLKLGYLSTALLQIPIIIFTFCQNTF